MSNAVEDAHQGLVAALAASASSAFQGLTVERDAALPGDEVPAFLNVVMSPEPARVLGEQMGLGEDAVLVEFVQIYDVEWIVRDDDDTARRDRFTAGQQAVAAALYADRTLGGKASALFIAPPNYERHTLAGAPFTSAVVIPVRVSLRGLGSVLS